MAVYTQVSDEELSAFLRDYDLGKVMSLKGIAGGVENTNYALHTSTGQYILTLYEKRVAEEDLPFFVGLMDHLAMAGFPCPNPIRDKTGNALGKLCGRPAAMVSFLEGMEVIHPTPEQCRMAGETMAALHESAMGFDLTRPNALAPSGWPELISTAIDRADEVEPGLAQLIASEMEHVERNWPNDIPSGVIHADMFKDNVFFLDGKLSGVIDFYFACNDFLSYDLAIAVNAWCFNDDLSFSEKNCAALVAGYTSRRALNAVERAAFPTLCRGAALRFLLTRLNDWLNVPAGALVVPHDPKQFSARLQILSKMTTANAFGLV